MEGGGEKEEEGESKELHRLHKGTSDDNQVVKISSTNRKFIQERASGPV